MKLKLLKIFVSIFFILTLLLTSACKSNKITPPDTTAPQSSVGNTEPTKKDTVTILYTNDVHAYLNNDIEGENGISYAEISALKKSLGENVLLVDAGDHIQGAVYGAMDEGQSIVEIMNKLYDVATIGNHEFDYGIDRTLYVTNNSAYPYISCNFVHKATEKPVLKPHILLSVGNAKVGFVGITTPETITSTAPSYFQNEKGEFIYDFLSGDRLYAAVQASIDALKGDGADYIVALGHVGVDTLSETTSKNIIANVNGLSAFIDGHSHTEIEKELVKDKSGNDVTLTQTGYYFGAVGKMTLSDSGVETQLIKELNDKDSEILTLKNDWVADVDEMLGQKIGVLDSKLTVDDENGNRLIRVSGTNLGEFVADSYYYYVNYVSQLNCDVAIINGGGVRANIEAGDVSYKSLKTVNPFGNMLCAVELTGQQILDMLEWGARITTGTAGVNEVGSFLHTAGLVYTIDTTVESTVQKNDQEIWTGAPTGKYRVSDVKIYDKTLKAYVDIDLSKTYCVAGANFTLTNCGDGFTMINGSVVKDYIVEDYMALAVYAIAFDDTNDDDLSDIISANSPLCDYEGYTLNYESPKGANRITIK